MNERFLCIMYGYPGSGKSYVAEWLCDYLHAVHLRTDDLRVKMFDGDRPELHTPHNKALVNNALRYASVQVLKTKRLSVVHDANHNTSSSRAELSAVARHYGAVPIVVWVQTPEDVARARERIKARADSGGHVIFHPDIIGAMKSRMQDPGPHEPTIIIDGMQDEQAQRRSFDEQLASLIGGQVPL